jgi:hypothetical protein
MPLCDKIGMISLPLRGLKGFLGRFQPDMSSSSKSVSSSPLLPNKARITSDVIGFSKRVAPFGSLIDDWISGTSDKIPEAKRDFSLTSSQQGGYNTPNLAPKPDAFPLGKRGGALMFRTSLPVAHMSPLCKG